MPTAGAPKWLDKVSFLKNFIFMRCEYPWYVFAETAGQPLFNLALTLASFDMLDMTRSLFRPKGLRTARHGKGRSRKNKGKGTPLIPEPSDILADTAREIEGSEKPKATTGTRHVWLIDGWLQRQLYKVMIFNLVTDFAYDWWSGIMSHEGANCDGGRVGNKDINNTVTPPDIWKTHNIPELMFQNGPVIRDTRWFLFTAGTWHVTYSGKVRKGLLSDGPNTVQFGLADTLSPMHFVNVTDPILLTTSFTRDFVVDGVFEAGTAANFMVKPGVHSILITEERAVGIRLDA